MLPQRENHAQVGRGENRSVLTFTPRRTNPTLQVQRATGLNRRPLDALLCCGFIFSIRESISGPTRVFGVSDTRPGDSNRGATTDGCQGFFATYTEGFCAINTQP